MDFARNCMRCDACRYAFFNNDTPVKSQNCYCEGYSKAQPIKTHERRTSSCSSRRSSLPSRLFSSTSDVKIPKGKSRKKGRSKSASKYSTPCVEQLRKDLQNIKEQLSNLTQNRNEALNVTSELQDRYRKLVRKSEQQQSELDSLKEQNDKLSSQLTLQNVFETSQSAESDLMETKRSFGQYDEKLGELYNEFVESAQQMGHSREQICLCIKGQTNQRQEKDNRDVPLVQKEQKYAKLKKCYHKLKEQDQKLKQQNKDLCKELTAMTFKFNKVMAELEKFRSVTVLEQQDEMRGKCQEYIKQLEEKSRKISELGNMLEELKSYVSECGKNEERDSGFEEKFNELMAKYKALCKKFKSNEEDDKKKFKELQKMREMERCLRCEICKLSTCNDELMRHIDDNERCIADLSCLNSAKESVIERQLEEIENKDNEIEELRGQLENTSQKLTRQVSNKWSCTNETCPNRKSQSKINDECTCLNLSHELQDLINTLYEEIDKALVKDEQIEKQYRSICCLQCTLAAKERELCCVRKELGILRDQFCKVVEEKSALVGSLKQLESQYCGDDYEDPFEVNMECYCED